jgi:hypothetical protein
MEGKQTVAGKSSARKRSILVLSNVNEETSSEYEIILTDDELSSSRTTGMTTPARKYDFKNINAIWLYLLEIN